MGFTYWGLESAPAHISKVQLVPSYTLTGTGTKRGDSAVQLSVAVQIYDQHSSWKIAVFSRCPIGCGYTRGLPTIAIFNNSCFLFVKQCSSTPKANTTKCDPV